jgi:ribosome biogenesis GTPase
VVILTKTDLVSPEEREQKTGIVRSLGRGNVIALSALTGDEFDTFTAMLAPGKTHCLLGSSGVGKTTLINRLIGRDAFDTKSVSGTGEGTHTTTRRQLIVLDNGAMLIDTPGMRELGLVGTADGISIGFDELVHLAEKCRYADCRHENEPGCAVRAAIDGGELSEDRFSSYIKLKKESDFHEMSYLDKRKKDKEFGRYIKTVKKQMKK